MRRRVLLMGLISAVAVETAAADRSTFTDPLETPSQRSPLAARSELMAVASVEDRLVAVGQRGHILLSADGGKRWEQLDSPVSSDLVAIHFSTPQIGWIVGHDGVVLHSADGGRSWTKRLDGRQLNALMLAKYEPMLQRGEPKAQEIMKDVQAFAAEGPAKPLLDVWFANEREGFLVGAFNLIFHTGDGGQTWEPWFERTENPQRFHLNAVRGDGEGVFIVGEQGLVLRLDRKQQRFVASPTPYRGSLFGLAVQGDTVVVCGLRGNALRSTDGGRTWSFAVKGDGGTFTAASVLADGRFVMVDLGGRVLVSPNAEGAFTPLSLERRGRIFAVAGVGRRALALAGDGGVQVVALN